MSDTYKIGTVTVAALGGGWYELKHDSLSEPKKVHGKEAADAEAAKIGGEPEGRMPAQGGIPEGAGGAGGDIVRDGDERTPAERVQERDAGLPDPTPPAPPAEPPVADPAKAKADAAKDEQLKAKDAEIAALKANQADFEKRFNDFLKAAHPLVASVEKAEEDPEEAARRAHGQVPLAIPREYSGQMDAKTKKSLKDAGIEVKTIVLEENESIPPTGLFVGHNGRSYMITPGEEVDVPDFLLGVLNDAVMSAPVVDAKSQKVLGYRNRSKYPYRLVN